MNSPIKSLTHSHPADTKSPIPDKRPSSDIPNPEDNESKIASWSNIILVDRLFTLVSKEFNLPITALFILFNLTCILAILLDTCANILLSASVKPPPPPPLLDILDIKYCD